MKLLLRFFKADKAPLKQNTSTWELHESIKQGHIKRVQKLLKEGLDPNSKSQDGWTPLYRAAFLGKLRIVKALLVYNADPRLCNDNRDAPLKAAVLSKNVNLEIIKLLLSKGVSPSVKDSFGNTPLFEAICIQNIAVINLLIEQGAQINITNTKGQSPLYYAIYCKSEPIVRLLLSKGADPNVKDRSEWIPLLEAVEQENIEIVNLLLSQKVNLDMCDKYDSTALGRAMVKKK